MNLHNISGERTRPADASEIRGGTPRTACGTQAFPGRKAALFHLLPLIAALFAPALCAAGSGPPPLALPAWISEVGAKHAPTGTRVFSANATGATGDGVMLDTAAIQKTIDACAAAGGGLVTFTPGRYLTGSLFLKSGVHLRLDAGVTLLGSQRLKDYPVRWTRVAGIEMNWPAALINVDGQSDVEISGDGVIDGQGEVWWKSYWALRKTYDPQGLRWAADYDCARPRLLLVWRSSDVTLRGLHLRRSGFWTVQLTYSERVTVDGLVIRDNAGPSTDGVDIDSSRLVLVQHCDIDNNDDDICLKAGRDTDGLRVNRPTEYVVIRDNVTRHGAGVVSFGSETSGGIRHIVAYDDTGIGTSEGLRFKSARTRGGSIEDVLIRDIRLVDVPRPFTFTLDWDPSYSYGKIPPGRKDIPPYWRVIAAPVEPPARGYCLLRDITIANVTATGAQRILTAAGLPQQPLGAVRWENVTAQGRAAGSIAYARDWTMRNVRFLTSAGAPVRLAHCINVATPLVERGPPDKN